MSRSRLWLTKRRPKQLGKELTEVIERYRQGRTTRAHPAGTRPVTHAAGRSTDGEAAGRELNC